MEEILVIKKEREKIKFKAVDKRTNGWSPSKYEKVISNKDFNSLALLFFDLHNMGYPMEKAYHKFKSLLAEPELFFLR